MANFNPGYKMEPTEEEVQIIRATRDGILREMVSCMEAGLEAESPAMLELVARYRSEFIDRYLYKSNLAILLGLSAVIGVDGTEKRAYNAYGDGLATYLATAMRAYCLAEEAKR